MTDLLPRECFHVSKCCSWVFFNHGNNYLIMHFRCLLRSSDNEFLLFKKRSVYLATPKFSAISDWFVGFFRLAKWKINKSTPDLLSVQFAMKWWEKKVWPETPFQSTVQLRLSLWKWELQKNITDYKKLVSSNIQITDPSDQLRIAWFPTNLTWIRM